MTDSRLNAMTGEPPYFIHEPSMIDSFIIAYDGWKISSEWAECDWAQPSHMEHDVASERMPWGWRCPTCWAGLTEAHANEGIIRARALAQSGARSSKHG